MKTIQLSADSDIAKNVLEAARSEEVLVTLSDGSEFLIIPADDFGWEVARTRANQEFMNFLEERSKEPGRISLAEIRKKIRMD